MRACTVSVVHAYAQKKNHSLLLRNGCSIQREAIIMYSVIPKSNKRKWGKGQRERLWTSRVCIVEIACHFSVIHTPHISAGQRLILRQIRKNDSSDSTLLGHRRSV